MLLLLAVCAIPFALAQSRSRGTTKRSGAGSVSQIPASQVPTGVSTCLVVNGDFETGELPPWTNTGDTSFTGVDSNNPHSGSFSLETGPATNDGFLDQVISTVAGTAYDVSFWLENQDDTGNNRFGVSFGGITLVPEASQSAFWVYAIYFYQCDARSQR